MDMNLDLATVEKEYGTDHPMYDAIKELEDEKKEELIEEKEEVLEKKEEENPQEIDPESDKKEDGNEETIEDDKVNPEPQEGEKTTDEKVKNNEDPEKPQDEEEVRKNERQKKKEKLVESLIINRGIEKERAEELVSKVDNIVDEFGNDIDKMALSRLESLQMISKQADIIKKNEEQLSLINNIDKENEVYINGQIYKKQQVIDQFKSEFPTLCVDSETGEERPGQEIFEQAMFRIKTKSKEQMESEQKIATEKMSIAANNKRNSLVDNAPSSLDGIKKEIRESLKKLPDDMVLHPDYNIGGIVRYIRGSDENIEKIKKEAYKKGKEDAKVVSSTKIVGDHGSSGSKGSVGLTVAEKEFFNKNPQLSAAYDLKNADDVKAIKGIYKRYNT